MNILITGAWREAEIYFEEIERMGHSVVFLQDEKQKLPCDYAWVEGIVCNGIFLHHPIERFVNLKYIQLTSAGFDRVPMEYVRSNNIQILNARGVYSVAMAEFALSGVLDLYKEKRFFFENQAAHKWEKRRNLRDLFGKKVCIVGCGSVGSECAKRFSAMGCEIFGVDIIVEDYKYFDNVYHIDTLKNILNDSDIVIVTVPLTKENYKMFNKELFESMKKDSVFVNIARGALVDTNEMKKALQSVLSGAVLDVFDDEPLPADDDLWDMKNVIITPHNSFVGDGVQQKLNELVVGNLRRVCL